jgi:hypothetical protein
VDSWRALRESAVLRWWHILRKINMVLWRRILGWIVLGRSRGQWAVGV